MLLKLVVVKCLNHASVYLLNNDFRNPCFGGLSTRFSDGQRYMLRCPHGWRRGFERGSGLNIAHALDNNFDLLTLYLINISFDLLDCGKVDNAIF